MTAILFTIVMYTIWYALLQLKTNVYCLKNIKNIKGIGNNNINIMFTTFYKKTDRHTNILTFRADIAAKTTSRLFTESKIPTVKVKV